MYTEGLINDSLYPTRTIDFVYSQLSTTCTFSSQSQTFVKSVLPLFVLIAFPGHGISIACGTSSAVSTEERGLHTNDCARIVGLDIVCGAGLSPLVDTVSYACLVQTNDVSTSSRTLLLSLTSSRRLAFTVIAWSPVFYGMAGLEVGLRLV
jgi:hypothetical protein